MRRLTDAGLILGLALWRLQVFLFPGKRDFTAPHFLRASIMHSVFLTGFALKNVCNPALASQGRRPKR